MVKKSLAAAERLSKEGINAEVIDPRTLAPLDVETILKSVKKTGHLVLVDQGTRHGSAAAIIAAEVAEHGFDHLKAPLKMVTALDCSVPYSEPLENYILPNEDKIVAAVKSVLQQARGGRLAPFAGGQLSARSCRRSGGISFCTWEQLFA